ncbi:UDP-4-amino-4,6-dideoxy-N-acetyl-beta-L-altrosamine N-acetyltransferase [Pseudomonas vranovensis]|nr:UDP-4-amino-4,6-dideoxy-N-acetyl-beta-L-altrosamine N-acetyltransferase [Pseudomonas vranovensis]
MQAFGKLRNIEADEVGLMLEWRNAPAVRANMYTRHVISEQEHLAWWQRLQQRQDQQYFMYEWHGGAAGIVGFTDIDTHSANASWAFYAAPDAAKGTGSRMEFLALEHAFNVLQLNKLNCEVLAFNSAVIKLHQKFAFQVEGIFREQHRVDDAYVDIYRLALLSREWDMHRDVMQEKLNKLIRGQ